MSNDEIFPAAQCGVVNVSSHNSQNELLFVHSSKNNWKVLDEKIQIMHNLFLWSKYLVITQQTINRTVKVNTVKLTYYDPEFN